MSVIPQELKKMVDEAQLHIFQTFFSFLDGGNSLNKKENFSDEGAETKKAEDPAGWVDLG